MVCSVEKTTFEVFSTEQTMCKSNNTTCQPKKIKINCGSAPAGLEPTISKNSALQPTELLRHCWLEHQIY